MTIASDKDIIAAAESVDGRQCVRATLVYDLLGGRRGMVCDWARAGRLTTVRLSAPRSRRTPNGRVTCYPLAEVLALAHRLRTNHHHHRWSKSEWALLTSMVGVLPVEEIAARLRRTVIAVQCKIDQLPVWDVVREQHRLIGTAKLARLVGYSNSNVVRWVAKHGCPHRRMADRRGYYLFNLAEVRSWLVGRWHICVRLDPTVRRRLGLRLDSGRVVLEQPQAIGGAA